MERLFDVIANEEDMSIVAQEELSLADGVALEEAGQAIAAADAVIAMVNDSESFADQLDTQIAVEEAMLVEPEQITAATATLALGSASLFAGKVGSTTAVGIEDEIVDPLRSFTIGLEEKRNIAKKLYDSAVIIMKKLVNMIKKAFAKVVMTLNGNEGSLKKLKKELDKVGSATAIKKDDIESILSKVPMLTYGTGNIASFVKFANGALAGGSEQEKLFTSVINTASKVSDSKTVKDVKDNLGTGLATTIFKDVHEYVATKKEKLFGDDLSGKYDFSVYSYTGNYARVLISSAAGNDTVFVKDKKFSLGESLNATYADDKIDVAAYKGLVDTAIDANKNIKKFLDSAMKQANKMLDLSSKTAKKADADDKAESEAVKIQVQVQKVGGTVGYSIAMDRFKNIRTVVAIGSKLVTAAKDNKKDKK